MIKNVQSYTYTLPYVFMAWCLIKNRDNFILYPVDTCCAQTHAEITIMGFLSPKQVVK
jgi:hypothetical protein